MVKQLAFCHLFQGDSVNTFFEVFQVTFLKVFAETFFKVRWIPFSRLAHQSVRKQLHVKLFQVRLCSFGEGGAPPPLWGLLLQMANATRPHSLASSQIDGWSSNKASAL